MLHEHMFGGILRILLLPPKPVSTLQPVSSDSVSDSRREAEYLCGLWLRPSDCPFSAPFPLR